MLDFAGTVAAAALMVFVANALLVFMDIPCTAKLVPAAAVGLWIGIAAAAGRSAERHRTVLHLWNAFGLADLATTIGLGSTSTAGSPLQVFHDAPGSAAMQTLPWSFVPTVPVPIWMILHAIVFVRLRRL